MQGRLLVIGVGLFAVVVLVGVLNSGRSGGDLAELADRVKGGLEEDGAPQPLADCTAERLEASFDNEEIERLYDSPRGQMEGSTAVVKNPKVMKALVRDGILCVLQLERSGQYNRGELIGELRGLAKPS
jgi:hypothetical protein